MDLSQIEFMKCISSIHLNEWSTDNQPTVWDITDILNDIVYKTNLLYIYIQRTMIIYILFIMGNKILHAAKREKNTVNTVITNISII